MSEQTIMTTRHTWLRASIYEYRDTLRHYIQMTETHDWCREFPATRLKQNLDELLVTVFADFVRLYVSS